MSNAARRKTTDESARPGGRPRKWRTLITTFRPWEWALLTLMVVACVTMAYAIYQQYTSADVYRMDYEGRIVGKSLTVTETQTGSGQRLRLHIRAANGEEFQIAVNPELYGRAREGMWIKSSRDGAQLSWDAPPRTTTPTTTSPAGR